MTGKEATVAIQLLRAGQSSTVVQEATGIPERTLRRWKAKDVAGEVVIAADGIKIGSAFYSNDGDQSNRRAVAIGNQRESESGMRVEANNKDVMVATLRTDTIRTLDGLLKICDVDLEIWEVERWVANKWDVAAKCNIESGDGTVQGLQATELWQVKAWFVRKSPEQQSIETILKDIADNSLHVPAFVRKTKKGKPRRELEISLMDPHMGLHCFAPESDMNQSIESTEQLMLDMIDRLVSAAETYAPFERILLPLGNDYMHVDGIFHTTTAGTSQPESDSWAHVYYRAEKLGIAMINRLLEVAPIKCLVIPGNHDRQSAFTLGRVWNAYYHNNKKIEFDASASPYKFHRFGVNLIGFEHGHSVQAVRLAALMANECRDKGWADARYCEWHIGDQHRKGSSKPSMMEEQGVSVEYLPGLTAPNSWHRIKSFNHQQRAGMAFVWDYNEGPQARLQVNLDNLSNTFMSGDHLP